MHITQLNIRASLENVTDLTFQDEKVAFYVKLQCDKCGTVSSEALPISAAHRIPIMGGRSYVNLVYKCQCCKRNAHLIILDRALRAYTLEDSNEFRTFAEFECRGARPVTFEVQASAFRCRSTRSKLKFENIKMIDDRSWAEYDECARVAVGIYDVHHKFLTFVVKK